MTILGGNDILRAREIIGRFARGLNILVRLGYLIAAYSSMYCSKSAVRLARVSDHCCAFLNHRRSRSAIRVHSLGDSLPSSEGLYVCLPVERSCLFA